MFYTYAHTKPDGTTFYVGKGQGRRAWDVSSRNRHWNHVVAKHGSFDVQILAEFEKEQDALEHEKVWVSLYRLICDLTNVTDGGDANPMQNPEVAKKCAETKRAKGQYTGKEISEYNASYKERMKDPEFAKQISDKRKKANAAMLQKQTEKMRDVVMKVRELKSQGIKQREISKMLGISEVQVSNIVLGKIYANI